MISLIASAVIAFAPPEKPLAGEVVERITPQACIADVQALARFGTRHTLSTTTDPERGIGAARNWLRDQFQAISDEHGGRLRVSMEAFTQPPTANGRIPHEVELVNVVAVLPGAMPEAAERRVYIVGHYDSRNSDGMDAEGDAPGANDDASGTAVVLACARALAAAEPLDATVVFLCTAGEEQGLLGARYHAESAAARGETIAAVLSNDIVGDPSAPEGMTPTEDARHVIRVFSEGLPRHASAEEYARIRNLGAENDSMSRQLARYIAAVAEREGTAVRPKLIFRLDRFLRGGDHSAFSDAGFPAVRFTEPDEDYSRQHQDVTVRDGKPYGDTAEYVDAGYLADVAKLNVAAAFHLANAPASPRDVRIITAALTNDTTLRWEANGEPDVAGYEVVWRETTAPDWQHARDVGNAAEATIDLNKDDWIFGVRAYDRAGFRSVVAFPGAAKE